ncbi:glutathione S-transferase [Sedimenticola selenatireducens]|uniref:Glutathione S-transferase n=1 Tax=Sedimenticola selenatireducens TaxID=191960 RepID=A0A557SES1_9GAMM|nr:glutathione S-transferase [Sedimenticola selenatireducens]TVO75842.1 glutathione S-transferase [Sedimenticola selenatireducens]TVT63701.1 MAG: glutathione S-transferase [Sedimenticola selenatireducens]
MNCKLPILYSFRRCPYAIRARLAIASSGQLTILREVFLKDRPEEFIRCSPKASVPVLQLNGGAIIDESLDIIEWALEQNDPDNWLPRSPGERAITNQLIEENDVQFKPLLDRYKYSIGYPEKTEQVYRLEGEYFLRQLEQRLSQSRYLISPRATLADMAIFPFIRQFAGVDSKWFNEAPYPHLRIWLQQWQASPIFQSIMVKYPQWKPEDSPTVFP